MDLFNYEIDLKSKDFNKFPHDFITKNDEKLLEQIKIRKEELKDELVILVHHYQSKWITELADFVGDSFELSKHASNQNANKIIFAGVHFMAESADILAKDYQTVYLPNLKAGCPMADMATIGEVESVWEQLINFIDEEKLIPVCYMNSTAEIKAFCGKHNGIVCTSSNAMKVFEWAFKRGEKLLFLPDKNLGGNTADKYGIPQSEQLIFNVNEYLGGFTEEQIKSAKVILWNGFCHVHTHFSPEMVEQIKKGNQNVKIIVHPEVNKDIIKVADEVGSTKYIVEYIKNSKPGDTIIVGTEINLVYKMAQMFKDRNIIPLTKSLCPNMYRINLTNFYETIMSFPKEKIVKVSPEIKEWARIALQRMLDV